jgi:predicted lysophospholipase L1 biosynthesis ABC-type transport system permease subunit
MQEHSTTQADLQHIKNMMERSSRFISLSGLSGISAGICALVGAFIAKPYVLGTKNLVINEEVAMAQALVGDYSIIFNTYLFWIAAVTFLAALISAFVFTWLKSKKLGLPLWGFTAKRVMINLAIPLAMGGLYIFKLLHYGTFGLVAPGCLIFYGLALVNASKFTLAEVRYLGYAQLILGAINLAFVGYGIHFWAIGFGVMHIAYGVYMWNKYERNPA